MSDISTLVVKLGSSSVTKETGPDSELLSATLQDALTARHLGWNVVLVSSGAVSSGTSHLAGFEVSVPSRVAAAVGQPLLMNMYASVPDSAFTLAQILVSQEDLRSPSQMRVVSDVLQGCFQAGIIPIVNGNDVVDPEGSDNDAVSAGIAVAIGAEKLLLLTDVKGVLQDFSPNAKIFEVLPSAKLRQISTTRSGTGRGGMHSKLRAAQLASYNGVETLIAHARYPRIIIAAIKGNHVGTRVPAVSQRRQADKRWIAGIAKSHGQLVVNREAESSIRAGSSLFASGIKKVRGTFRAGDVIEITSPQGELIARGCANVSSSLMTLVRAMQSDEVGRVMAEIIFAFAHSSSSQSQNRRDTATEHLRWPVAAAIEILNTASLSYRRSLAVELLELFPQTAVSCMTDMSRRNSRKRLSEYYGRLSSDLSFVNRGKLIVL